MFCVIMICTQMMFVCIVGAATTTIEHENDFSLQESETNISIVQSSTESELIIYIILYIYIYIYI